VQCSYGAQRYLRSMPHPEWFESWFGSPYYHILYEQRDDEEAEAFADALLRYLDPSPGARMLDIACGEGRLSRSLAARGYDVTGIDLSHASISLAQRSEAPNLHFYVHDMRMPFYVNYFNLAFNFFTSFGYFGKPRDHHMAARAFASALKPGGFLVVDYLNVETVLAGLVPEEEMERGGINFSIRRRYDGSHFIKEIRFNDRNGNPQHFTERVAAFRLADFLQLFRKVKLGLVNTFGDYRLQPFNPGESPRLVMVLKKHDG
jgi:SAM-dependent methyltransferase